MEDIERVQIDALLGAKRETTEQDLLMLTNFHKNHLGETIAVEIPDELGQYSPIDPDYLFAVAENGAIDSPLSLVRPELAGAILELFEDVPKIDSVSAMI